MNRRLCKEYLVGRSGPQCETPARHRTYVAFGTATDYCCEHSEQPHDANNCPNDRNLGKTVSQMPRKRALS